MLPKNGIDDTNSEEDVDTGMLLNDLDDLPRSIFACDIPKEVFDDSEQFKDEFEELFLPFGATNFLYFHNFRRARVYFETPQDAAGARIALHECVFRGQVIKIFFAQVEASHEPSGSLQPPQPERFFLISPPASPPVGWEPARESEPVINYDLMAAIANLEPGQSREIHPGTGLTPSVVLHACENSNSADGPKLKIQQTRRPDVMNS